MSVAVRFAHCFAMIMLLCVVGPCAAAVEVQAKLVTVTAWGKTITFAIPAEGQLLWTENVDPNALHAGDYKKLAGIGVTRCAGLRCPDFSQMFIVAAIGLLRTPLPERTSIDDFGRQLLADDETRLRELRSKGGFSVDKGYPRSEEMAEAAGSQWIVAHRRSKYEVMDSWSHPLDRQRYLEVYLIFTPGSPPEGMPAEEARQIMRRVIESVDISSQSSSGK